MQILWTQQMIFIMRILLAGTCGIAIGLERKNRAKEAGIRTHFVVACAAALMMIVSKYAFFDVITEGIYGGVEVRLDPSRVASTIASGIGFLGAGMIFVHKNTITGLTTAAGIWATSGVGMAIGAGMYVIGIAATVLILLAQVLLHMNFKWSRALKTKVLSVKNIEDQTISRISPHSLRKWEYI
ncbi:MAG: MgtC/SapB family protein [Clostridia bacterium]|nr:MgtC/SapB family protein [Clostridia bacterium]